MAVNHDLLASPYGCFQGTCNGRLYGVGGLRTLARPVAASE
jgi:hypothetical protein